MANKSNYFPRRSSHFKNYRVILSGRGSLVNDAPDVMLYNRNLTVGAQKYIKGLGIHPVTLYNFATVYIEE
ncbi:hypothetical protein [Fusobacterium mortiferum]|uniref:Uncharacterized protein n=1 Tax=Fusobacterium mortiferum TaxID=850 RepID=A0ABS2G3C7_FUSMR|nr:hypothetical protein [Fusobacterium mortiferum]MBM6875946.1 hypothetical protein [Fusobacterium mortiferum]